jgi:hypothetical protein
MAIAERNVRMPLRAVMVVLVASPISEERFHEYFLPDTLCVTVRVLVSTSKSEGR